MWTAVSPSIGCGQRNSYSVVVEIRVVYVARACLLPMSFTKQRMTIKDQVYKTCKGHEWNILRDTLMKHQIQAIFNNFEVITMHLLVRFVTFYAIPSIFLVVKRSCTMFYLQLHLVVRLDDIEKSIRRG